MPVEPDPYFAAWARMHRLRVAIVWSRGLAWAAGIGMTVVAAWHGGWRSPPTVICILLFVAFGFVSALFEMRLRAVRCPHCAEPFSTSNELTLSFPDVCEHCGIAIDTPKGGAGRVQATADDGR
jgi:hypothetical protein